MALTPESTFIWMLDAFSVLVPLLIIWVVFQWITNAKNGGSNPFSKLGDGISAWANGTNNEKGSRNPPGGNYYDKNTPAAGKGELNVAVMNSHTRRPLPGSRVYITPRKSAENIPNESYVLTDGNGKVSLFLPQGTYDIFAWSEGFTKSDSKKIKVKENSQEETILTITPKLHLQSDVRSAGDKRIVSLKVDA